jgi:mRNA interferase MazF
MESKTLRLLRPHAVPPEPAVRVTLKAAPAIRNVYSCRFPEAALPPEFSKRRPVIVVSWKNSLSGPVLVIPVTTQSQAGNQWAIKLSRNPSPGEGCDVWAVCNHLYTVSCTRLTATHGTVPRLTAEEFRPIHELMLKWVPALLPGVDKA